MGELSAGQERELKQLISTFRCQVCHRDFRREHVRVTARHEELVVVSVRCGLCRNHRVFWVALKEAVQADERDADLARREQEYFASLPPLGGDDVLAMHQFLQDFEGDFLRHFSP